MTETGEETPHPGEPQSEEEAPHPGEPQTEEELERLVDKELEDVGKEDQNTTENDEMDAQQRAIDEQLRKMREELEMDSTSPDELSQEYDLGARVRQLNEELAREGPAEEKKNRKVNFHENIVSLAVPPPEYPDDEIAMANEEAEKLEAGDGDALVEDGGVQGRGEEGEGIVEGVDGQHGAEEGSFEEGSTVQSPVSVGGDPGQEQDDISPAPAESLPNRTDETDTSVSQDGQNQMDQQEPLPQQVVVTKTDTEEGSVGRDHHVERNSSSVSGSDDPNDLEVQRLTLRPQEQNRTLSPNSSQGQGEETSSSGLKQVHEDEHILIERGGKFFYVNVQDLSPEERETLGVTLVPSKEDSKRSGSELPLLQPRPPQKPRPSTACGGENRSNQQRQLPPRAMSAKTSKEYDKQERMNAAYQEPFGNARSRYGMTPEQKQHRRDQARLKAQKMKEDKEREEQEKQEKEEMCEGVFKAWLEQKKGDNARRRREEKGRTEESKEERCPQEAFDAWLHRKKDERKAEGRVKQRLSEQEREAYFMRSRAECERAFKDWRRSKNAGLREAHALSRAGALESKKRAHQSRKSRNLAKALEVAQTYRYDDYYGYRY